MLLQTAAGTAPSTTFEQRPERCQAQLLVDVTLDPNAELPELAQALETVQLPVLLLVRPPQIEGWTDVVDVLQAEGVELGLLAQWPEPLPEPVRSDVTIGWSRLRQERRELRRATGSAPRVAGVTALSPALEGSLDIFGYSLLLPAVDGLLQAPRRNLDLQGSASSGIVIWPVQPLEDDERLGSAGGLEALLDRAALALERGDHPVVRVTVSASMMSRHGALLQRWWEEVVHPCGAAALSRAQAEDAVRAWLRDGQRGVGQASPQPRPSTSTEATAIVDADQLMRAAEELACTAAGGATLPRTAGHGLDLTQAWLALSLALAGQQPPLTLYPVLAPRSSPRSVLPPEGVSVSSDDLRSAGSTLTPRPGQQVSSFARVGDQALTAAELLCAMASAFRGEDPVTVTRTYSPDPYAPGLGWGGY